MTIRQHLSILFISALLAAIPNAPLAKTITVEVTGKASESGLGQSSTRLRALEAALIEAAIEGGADINGYAATSNGVLFSERLILRPASRVLDYTILSEKEEYGFYIVKIRAVVGDPPTAIATSCGRRAELDIVAMPLRINISPLMPAWLANLGPVLNDRIIAAITVQPGVHVTQAPSTGTVKGRSASVGREMDYASLMSSQLIENSAPEARFTLYSQATLQMQGQRTLKMVLQTRLVETTLGTERATTRTEHFARLSPGLPIRALDLLATPDHAEIMETLLVEATSQITAMIDGYACRPLDGVLQLTEDLLTLPLGSKDGLTRNHLAFSEGQDNPFTLFEIVTLYEHSSIIQPIDRNRSANDLAGVRVRFMELTQ